LPGIAAVLDDGVPPGNVHAYEAIVPSSAPLPENGTGAPGLTVTFDAGLSIEAVGAWLGGGATTSVTPAVRVTGPLVP